MCMKRQQQVTNQRVMRNDSWLVSWSLTSLVSTNMAIPETNMKRQNAHVTSTSSLFTSTRPHFSKLRLHVLMFPFECSKRESMHATGAGLQRLRL